MKEFYFDMPCGVTIVIKAETLAQALKVDSQYDLSARFKLVDATEDEPIQVLLPEMPSVDENCLQMVSDLESGETWGRHCDPERFQSIIDEYCQQAEGKEVA